MKAVTTIPLNFHQTFLPDRNLIAKLLKFSAENGSGNKETISGATGIPTGERSGKVEPMIHYALAMGLITAHKSGSLWQLALTPIGQVVYEEDPYLSETITLWLLHLMMCRRVGQEEPARGIVDPWFALFADRGYRLGHHFTNEHFRALLAERHGHSVSIQKLSSLVVRAYEEGSALSLSNALQCAENDQYHFLPAPRDRNFYPLYSAYLLLLWDEFYPGQQQVHLSELYDQTRLLTLFNWTATDVSNWLDWMTDHRVIQLDRQTGEALALRLQTSQQAVQEIYSLLI